MSGAGRSNEGSGEEQHDQETVPIGPQGGGEAGESRGEVELAGTLAGATGGAHLEDRAHVVPVPVLQLVHVLKTKQNSDCV